MAVVALLLCSPAFTHPSGHATIAPRGDLKWTSGGVPEVNVSPVEGDMAKGPSHFFLKYAAGFASPLHHHSADHFVTTVSGTLVLVVDGKEHRLPPGSYFAFTEKKPHQGRCEGKDDCVMFADARGPWDVVMEEQPPAKP